MHSSGHPDEFVRTLMHAGGLWFSIGLGVGLGVVYIAASFVSNKRALRSKRNAMLIVVTTMVVRIVIALALLVIFLQLLPIAPAAFLGSFFVIFVVGLIVEIWILHGTEAPTS